MYLLWGQREGKVLLSLGSAHRLPTSAVNQPGAVPSFTGDRRFDYVAAGHERFSHVVRQAGLA